MDIKFKEIVEKIKNSQIFLDLVFSIFSIILALSIGAFLIYLSGYDVGLAYKHLINGAFGNSYNIAQTFIKTIPLIFTGLAVAIGFRAGVFNIGGEGQLYWGAFIAAVTAISLQGLPAYLLMPISLLAGSLAGGLWASVPGYLKAYTGAHEVVTTIMLNYVAIFGTTFLVKNFFKAPGGIDQTVVIPVGAQLPVLIKHTRLTFAIFVAVIVIIIIDFIYKKTALGFDLQSVGHNSSAAEYAGISSKHMIVTGMFISGAVAGLAGSTMVMGVLHRFITNFSPGYGYSGIAVAVLGRKRPWGVFLAALLFGILESGGMAMKLFAKIPSDLMTVVQGLVILFVSAPALIEWFRDSLAVKDSSKGVEACE